jgi:Mrp family chromosome partitioning ATPase
MAQAEQSRFKSTIIGPSFARAAETVRAEGPRNEPSLADALRGETLRIERPRIENPYGHPHAEPSQRPEPPQREPARNDGRPQTVTEPVVVEVPTTVVRRADEVRQGPLAVRGGASHSVVIEAVTLPTAPDPRLVMLDSHASAHARAFRLLRHRLLAQGDPRIIAVTSAEPGEGKTTCAANLALALADETFARVLLLEANLRRPAFAALFGYSPAPTFMDRLVQYRDATPPYAVAGVNGTRLHLAALPGVAPNGARLDRLLLSVVLQDLRSAYDYIVVDSSAVLESADADVIGHCSDGVILATRTRMSRTSAIDRAVAELSPSRVLGSVLLDA